jgi:NADH dehydrogenase FAD-containing subunit
VVVVGAGFAGLEVGKRLRHAPAQLTVIDRRNYMLFQPLLYQVATAALSPADIAAPIRSLICGNNTEILLDEVVGVEAERSVVQTGGGREIPFDFLVIATGSQYNYFGKEEWAAFAPSPKSLDDALEIRRRVLLAFEAAEMCNDSREQRALLTIVIVGAGPTGAEIAGAIAEMARFTLLRDFRHINPASARIILMEAGPRILAGFSPKLGAYAQNALAKLGVEVWVNSKIENIDGRGVVVHGERIEARLVIWAAGVKATPAAPWLKVPANSQGMVEVNADFSLPGHSNIFVIGDAALVRTTDGTPLPGLAAVAKQEGAYVGNLIRCRLSGDPEPTPFRYRDYGTMAIVGRSSAVADLRGFKLKGTLAWLLWGLVHLYFLVGFRNRLFVLITWFWSWLTYKRGARLITGRVPDPRFASVQPPQGDSRERC